MPGLLDQRQDAANKSLAEYDFQYDVMTDSGKWNIDDDRHNEWTTVLRMEDEEGKPYTCGFIVRFKPDSAEVTEAYPGDRH